MADENENQAKTPFSLKMRELHEIELEAARKTLAPRELSEEVEIACATEIDKKRKQKYDEDASALKARNPDTPIRPYMPFTRENVFSSKNVLKGGKNFWAIVSDDGQKYYFEPSEEVYKFRKITRHSDEQERLKTMPSIFISYSRNDLSVVLRLEQALLANGHIVWRDQESLYGGQQWPKAIGEAIASRDIFLLAWSQRVAASHFVEFEWNTALALKKVIVPCLLDDTPLPPALNAIHGISCNSLETGLTRVLQALQQPFPVGDSSYTNAVLTKLQTLPAAAPEKVVQAAKILFTQQNWNVQGNVYQAVGDIHVSVPPPPEKQKKKLLERWQTWVAFLSTLVVLIGAMTDLPLNLVQVYKTVAGVAEECQFSGTVVDNAGNTVAGAEVLIIGETNKDTTDANGLFSFEAKRKVGETVEVMVIKDGVKGYNGLETLPGPVTLMFAR